MGFRLREDSEKWFNQIKDDLPFRSKWDMYYFCLMAGLATGRRSNPTAGGRNAPEFVSYIIDDYKPARNLILGLLILAETKRFKIDITEKKSVQKLIKSMIDPHQSQTGLTDEGESLLNAYASGGYEYLSENREAKPYSAEEFFRDYAALISSELEKAPFWEAKKPRSALSKETR